MVARAATNGRQPMFVFDYAIRFADGTFYTGRAGSEYKGSMLDAFTYTLQGAHAKIARMGWPASPVNLARSDTTVAEI